MKRFFVAAILFALMAANAFSQSEKSEINTLFSSGEVHHSGYGALTVKGGSFDSETAFFVGARGGWLVNNTFSVGIQGEALMPLKDRTYVNSLNETITGKLTAGIGGIYFEYIHNPNDLIHFTGKVFLGFGAAVVNEHNEMNDHVNNNDYDNHYNGPWGAFYVIEPEVSAEMNITNFFKIGVSAAYRFGDFVEKSNTFEANKNLSDMKIGGFSCGINLIFGSF